MISVVEVEGAVERGLTRSSEAAIGGRTLPPSGWAMFSPGDCFMVWAVRQWFRSLDQNATNRLEIYDGFEFHGLIDALRPMGRFMAAILVGRYRDLEINDPSDGDVSQDEMAILRALALAQAGHADLCETRLMTWLPRAAARVAMPHARRLARVLTDQGMRLTLDGAAE